MANAKHADPLATTGESGGRFHGSQPLLHQHRVEVERFGEMRALPHILGGVAIADPRHVPAERI
jgi:hypothetical protein